MFGQNGGDVVAKVGGVVDILDVGAVDAEDVLDPRRRKISDDVINNPADHSLILSHSLTCFRTCK